MFKEQKILGEKRLNDYTQPLETRMTKKHVKKVPASKNRTAHDHEFLII